MRQKMMVVILVLLFSVSVTSHASANVISFFETQFNTDWATAGLGGLRGVGNGTINLTGTSGTVNKAYLYWHGPTNSTDPNVNANVVFNGTNISGTNIGFSDDNFWSFQNSQAYRADVSALVTGDGNYSLSGFTNSLAEINGVSLVAFYDDGNSANNVDVVLFDGNDANFTNGFDPLGWNISLSGINYTAGTGKIVMGVSDGQNFGSTDDGNLILNGTTLASGGIFQGDSTPFGTGGVSNGKLWDIKEFDITSFFNVGPNTLNLSMTPVTDALSFIHAGIVLPAGAAPNNPTIPEPATMVLMSIGLTGLGLSKKKKA